MDFAEMVEESNEIEVQLFQRSRRGTETEYMHSNSYVENSSNKFQPVRNNSNATGNKSSMGVSTINNNKLQNMRRQKRL